MSEIPSQTKPKRAPKPKRPTHLSSGRWLGDLGVLSRFEKRLVAACARGEVCAPDNWDGKRPEADAATEANTIRAELIRFLALGGDGEHPVHEEGVMLSGGWIEGALNLHHAAAVRLDLKFCHFDSTPNFLATSLPGLGLLGSKLPGLSADRMKATGSVFLGDDFIATGVVKLSGAHIGGNLELQRGHFSKDNNGLIAFNANSLIVVGSMLMTASKFDGQLFLTSAHVGSLIDDSECWPKNSLVLSGFTYDRITDAPTDAMVRIKWLKNQQQSHLYEDFRPQPWEQLIKILHQMGYPFGTYIRV